MRIFIEPLHILKKDGYRMKIQFDFIADVLISATGESDVNAVYCDENVWRITAADGKTYNTNHYNLSTIIAVPTAAKSTWG